MSDLNFNWPQIQLPNASLHYVPDFIPRAVADTLLDQLLAELNWQQSHIQLFGRRVLEPRLTSWYADAGVVYGYSGRQLNAQAWPDCLHSLRTQLCSYAGHHFNAVLANLYRNGMDSMGWHSDDESSLGVEPIIASISLGAERDFVLRRKDNHRIKHCLGLAHGSLLLMQAQTQHFWQHALPRRKRITQPRVNLTFRLIKS